MIWPSFSNRNPNWWSFLLTNINIHTLGNLEIDFMIQQKWWGGWRLNQCFKSELEICNYGNSFLRVFNSPITSLRNRLCQTWKAEIIQRDDDRWFVVVESRFDPVSATETRIDGASFSLAHCCAIFLGHWVLKYSTGWWPPICGCRSERNLLRPKYTKPDPVFCKKGVVYMCKG